MPADASNPYKRLIRTVVALGTRPEAIKLSPVITALANAPAFRPIVVSSGQHTDLLTPFIAHFGVTVDHQLNVMEPGQSLNRLFARVLTEFDAVLGADVPDVLIVQGDTTTAAAAALAAFHRRIPVAHVEAGLRTEDPDNPFPEEMNRRLVSRVARWHYAATSSHAENLIREGVPSDAVVVTGNPVVDALQGILSRREQSPELSRLLSATAGLRRVTVTTHRRESFGERMEANLRALRRFVEEHPDVAVIFPMHPNPAVRAAAGVLNGVERVWLTDPLDYSDFIGLLAESWVIASDSGGVQEEAPSLGVPLLILRENTERPEILDTGLAKLCPTSDDLTVMLEEMHRTDAAARPTDNPFGDGRAAERIVAALAAAFGVSAGVPA
ncbi:MAG: UDP-N-acetylglucosamine 2-epimerase (non-hydrolyzing) [Fimbriiglobus sp.]|jgi:UDP-N-acetylglucosamine 2-epimerase (non-hydrolysing)|nr:UDP-N-acetylglucosamine 2-epimerase (non-hydrolyzing) [Fimbriiglobus sp.]